MRRHVGILAAMLLASLVAAQMAETKLPVFANKDKGPPDGTGVWEGPRKTGPIVFIQNPNGFAGVFLRSNDPADWVFENGTYTSYECDPSMGKGAYKSILHLVLISANGTRTESDSCEIGKIDLAAGTYVWADGDTSCPTKYDGSARLINSTVQMLNSNKPQVC